MTAATHSFPAVGTRLVHSGHIGTVRYVGAVDGTQGTWLGVEWDDPKRGKHDGVKDGRRYFTCLTPNSGSFIRPSAAISYGTSFLKALIAKYVEIQHGSGIEKVILGSSKGAIEVEAVNLNKIRGNLARVEKLREASLDNEQVAFADPPGEIGKTCPGIRGLDLSKNLFSSWDTVSLIVVELPRLERLAVNLNRLQMPSSITDFCQAFKHLKELQISATLTTWSSMRLLVSCMPQLQLLEAGYNELSQLVIDDHGGTSKDLIAHTGLAIINFDSNQLTSWASTCEALRSFSGLQKLLLSGNRLAAVDEITDPASSPLQGLKHLSLASNALRSWADIDRIPRWCPDIESLALSGNPLVEDETAYKNARQLAIAKIPSLVVLDSAQITPKERTDCELFYLSYISRQGPSDDDARASAHPQWKALCEKHGRPYIAPPDAAAKADTLGNKLFQITVQRCRDVSGPAPDVLQALPLRVLPSMALRTFRLKVAKSFKVPRAQQGDMKLWLRMPDGNIAAIDGDDTHDLSWWGLEDGALILLVLE